MNGNAIGPSYINPNEIAASEQRDAEAKRIEILDEQVGTAFENFCEAWLREGFSYSDTGKYSAKFIKICKKVIH